MEPGFLPIPAGFSTRAIHAGQEPEKSESMSVVPPMVLSTIFALKDPTVDGQLFYGRCGNPSRNCLEECLASLENAKYGICFASGLGCMTTLMSMFQYGDHLISGEDIYGGSRKIFDQVGTRFGCKISYVDVTDIKKLEAAIKPNTKLIWIESPTNPILSVVDIKAVSLIAKKHNIIFAVDNTFMTPYLQRPLELGADLSCYSLTKYMNGHNDVIMGAILTNNVEMHKKIKSLQSTMGVIPSPFDCAMVTRGLKTLPIRMRQHSLNATIVAKFLETHPRVLKVIHPGLPSHPQYELTKKQSSGHCGMVAMYIKGDMSHSRKFVCALKIFISAGSLGGPQSLALIPCLMSHASLTEAQRIELKVTDNLVRLSVGLEDAEDLIADLNQALLSM